MLLFLFGFAFSAHYKSFKVAVYTRAQEVIRMADRSWLESTWKTITDQVAVDKIYLETHRDLQIVNSTLMSNLKKWFQDKGVEVGGGITYTINEANNFETFCFSDPDHRKYIRQLAEEAARHHDQFLLDDFFFSSCKSDVEIQAKGNKTWSDYRRALLAEAGKSLVVGPAHSVNPNVSVVIKYPNWYEHFAGLGFDLAAGPKIFDGVWTGTETRDPSGNQHLQNYLSYSVIRYFENCAPGKNGGGWVDVFGVDNPKLGADRYAEQLWLTAFAKAKQVNLFAYNWILDWRLNEALHKTSWQGQGSSFNWATCTAPFTNEAGQRITPTTFARVAGCVFEQIDKFVSKLGKPIGIKTYHPPNSANDDYLETWLGMIGLPIEMVPTYPTSATVVLLTARAASDPDLASKMSATIRAGGNIVVTSGLIAVAPDVVSKIVELRASKYMLINQFTGVSATTKDILIRQIWYNTNDAWELASAGRPFIDGTFGIPVLLRGLYGQKGGGLYALAIPEDFSDLYLYPESILNTIRSSISGEVGIHLRGPAKVSLFVYDNGYFIVENFLDRKVEASVVLHQAATIQEEGATTSTRATAYVPVSVNLNPHQYRVFKATR